MRRSDGAAPPRALTVAGSDSGGGAGIQADLKTFAAHGVYGTSAITAVTAQNTLGVRAVAEVPAEVVAAQIDAVFEDIGADAVKVGMLASVGIVEAVADRLAAHCGGARGDAGSAGPPVVVDPVMVAKSGDPLLADDAVEAVARLLVPLAALLTPNAPEAARLTGRRVTGRAEQAEVGRRLAESGCAVLMKGGHLAGEEIVDVLVDGDEVREIRHPRRETRADHGTGCTLSSAVAARLARGESLGDAVDGAIRYLDEAMVRAWPIGGGHGPVHHFHAFDRSQE